MLNKLIIKRRDSVQEYILRGYSQAKIAEILKVHPQTVYNDVKKLNTRYAKYISKNPDYLKNKLDKILRFIDELNHLKTEYWKLRDKAGEEITVAGKDGKQLTIPRGSIDDERKALDSIVKLISEEAKILQLTGKEDKFLQQNFIHVDKINAKITPLIEFFVQIIYKFVPLEAQQNAFIELKTYKEEDEDDK